MLEEPKSEQSSWIKSEKLSLHIWVRFAIVVILAVLAAVLATHAVLVGRFSAKESEEAYRFRVLQQYMEKLAYYDYDYDAMLEEAVRAYVAASGDDYTIYYNAEEFEQLEKANRGNYVGIGVSAEGGVTVYEGETLEVLRITAVRKGSPAQKAGLLKGDEILTVTTEAGEIWVNNVSYTNASSLIRGEAGTSVELSVLREVSDERVRLTFSVLREELVLESVEYRVSETDATVGILSISGFDLTTPNALRKGMDALLGKGIRRFVIDLRDNGGGDLSSVIACSSLFLKKNDLILSTQDKNGRETEYTVKERLLKGQYEPCTVRAEDIGKYRGYSYAILINGNTASAAELLAAVFRDYSMGTLIGERSFGKGSVQGLYSLSDIGLEGGLRVTTKMYFPPCGEGYHNIGIAPDVEVAFPKDKHLATVSEQEDTQLMCAIEKLLK